MRTVLGQALVAIAFLIAGAIFWTEARLTRQVALADEQFATLDYAAEDGVDESSSFLTRLVWRFGALSNEVRRLRIQASYWRGKAVASDPTTSTADTPPAANQTDAEASPAALPDQLLAAANAAFRSSRQLSGDRALVVDRLDKVMQVYGEILRADAANVDASFNYEYAARYRDAIARGSGSVRPTLEAIDGMASRDLPFGPTIHGQPGRSTTDPLVASARANLREAGPARPLETMQRSEAAPRPEPASTSQTAAVMPQQPAAPQTTSTPQTTAAAAPQTAATSQPGETRQPLSRAFDAPTAKPEAPTTSAPSPRLETRSGSATISASAVTPVLGPGAPASRPVPPPESALPPGAPRVFFMSPRNGETFLPYELGTFEEPVGFEFGIANYRIAGVPDRVEQPRAGVGHYHFGVETECLPAGAVIPTRAPWTHLDAGETKHGMILRQPGQRTFTVQVGDDQQRAVPGLCSKITITVLP